MIVRARSDWPRDVFAWEYENMCGVKMFCSSSANHTSTNFKMCLSWQLDKLTLFTHSLVGCNLENLYKHAVPIFFRLSWHFKREKLFFGKHLYCKTWELITRTLSFVYKTLRLVRISLLISNLNKEFFFFWGKLYYKSNRKLFSCVCIAWYKHSRVWENSWQLCKPETTSRVCITVSNSPNPLSVYIRLCKHRKKAFYCLNIAFLEKYCYFAVYKQFICKR